MEGSSDITDQETSPSKVETSNSNKIVSQIGNDWDRDNEVTNMSPWWERIISNRH